MICSGKKGDSRIAPAGSRIGVRDGALCVSLHEYHFAGGGEVSRFQAVDVHARGQIRSIKGHLICSHIPPAVVQFRYFPSLDVIHG